MFHFSVSKAVPCLYQFGTSDDGGDENNDLGLTYIQEDLASTFGIKRCGDGKENLRSSANHLLHQRKSGLLERNQYKSGSLELLS